MLQIQINEINHEKQIDHFGGSKVTNIQVQLFVGKVFFINVTMNSEIGIQARCSKKLG
jgi:hypothetical protein